MWENQEISQDDLKVAINTRDGPTWDKAMAQAELEVESEVSNPFDFVNLLISPSLPIQWAYQALINKTPEKINQLPITRFIQNVTGAAGANQGLGVNIEAPFRKALGLPEMDRFQDFRVDRELATMAAEGVVTPEEANLAMIDRTGNAYLLAQQRVAQAGRIKYMGAPLGADLFPEGEQDQRAIKAEYDKARDAWVAGDDKAMTKFYETYPEYDARIASFQDPQERLRRFMISSVWDAWRELPDLYQDQVKEQLGEPFEQAFLQKETRSYDSIDTETLAFWGRVMNGVMPQTAPETPNIALDLAPPEIAAEYQRFADERERKFPNIGNILNQIYSTPEGAAREAVSERTQTFVDEYYKWRNQQFADHPDIIQYAISDSSEMAGQPPEIQGLFYQFQSMRENYFPGWYEMQAEYYDLPSKQRKAYREKHPLLPAYWDFRRQYMAQFPQMIPFLMSEESLAEAVLGEDYYTPPQEQIVNLQDYPPALVSQMMQYQATGQLSSGAREVLYMIWERNGKPQGSFNDYLAAVTGGP